MLGPCQHGEMRFANGATSRRGVVEICIDGQWGTLCANDWDNTDATVACRQQGYSPYGTSLIPMQSLPHMQQRMSR